MNKSKTILIEKSEPLKYIKESGTRPDGKHYLGKLAGPGATWIKPTRNGRRYPYELWVNVENSDDFKEGMSTLTIFGEADHPETRIDTSIKEIAIVLTKYEIRRDEGIVYTEFDILDTPNGRIIKELCDYGSKLGVSSRGLGDEVVRDGEKIIDPDTYIFYGFDAVVMPAVTSARPKVIESVESDPSKSLLESFNREIENATSRAELESIGKLAESANIPNLDSVKESINTRLSSYDEGEDISSLKADLASKNEENDKLKRTIESLESKLSAKDIRIKDLTTILSESNRSSSNLRKLLMNAKLELKTRDEAIIEDGDHIDELTDCLEDMKVSYNQDTKSLKKSVKSLKSRLESQRRISSDRVKALRESKNKEVSDIKMSYETTISSLKESNSKMKRTISSLRRQVESIESSKKLSESAQYKTENTLKRKLSESKSETRLATDKYLKLKCTESNIDIQTAKYNLPDNYSVEDIDRVVSKLADRKIRMSKLPFTIEPRSVVINELGKVSEEDAQTMRFLESSKHNL